MYADEGNWSSEAASFDNEPDGRDLTLELGIDVVWCQDDCGWEKAKNILQEIENT